MVVPCISDARREMGCRHWGSRCGDGSPGWKGAKWVGIRWRYGKPDSASDGQYLQVLCVVWIVAVYLLRCEHQSYTARTTNETILQTVIPKTLPSPIRTRQKRWLGSRFWKDVMSWLVDERKNNG